MGYLDSLVSWWDMSTINPPDLGFRQLGNDGVGTGLVTATDIVNGVGGGMATEFDGATEFITCGANGFVDMIVGSFCVWYRIRPGSTGFRRMFCKGQPVSQQASALIFDTTNDIHTFCGTARQIDTNYVPTEGEWHFLVLTFDADETIIYNDGAVIGGGLGHTGAVNADGLTIGDIGGVTSQKWDGLLDTFMIFDILFTNLQVTDLMLRTRRGQL